jgi:hypothetical protein
VARPNAVGQLVLAPDAADDDERARHVLVTWPTVTEPGGEPGPSQSAATGVTEPTTHAILARTNRELLPAAAIALELGIPFRAERLALPLEDPRLDGVLAAIEAPGGDQPLLVRLASLRRGALTAESGDEPAAASEAALSFDELLAAVLAWAAPYRDASEFSDVVRARRLNLADLRRDDAALTLATAHSTKGLEFDHVAVVDMDAGRFPSQRTLDDADDPDRALEEERRLAYVAWTRARRSLTLIYDPAAPSCFLLEAFDPVELGLEPTLPTPVR